MHFDLLNKERGNVSTSSNPPQTITLTAHPGTDIWRKPPATLSFNAPILQSSLLLSDFKRARVTVTGPWKTLFDQGGLCLYIPLGKEEQSNWKWVKTGIEFYEGSPHVGTVACDMWADWSLFKLEGDEVTVEMEREVKMGERKSSMWVYIVESEGKRRPIREITWVFNGVEQADQPCYIGVYAAKPTMDKDDKERGLKVTFKHFQIETWKDGVFEM